MKRLGIIIISVLSIVLLLCSCSSPKDNNEGEGMANPVSECTIEELTTALGLKEIKLDADNVCKIDGEDVIYSFDVVNDGVTYNVRLAKYREGMESNDISGVYLSGKVENACYDSASAEAGPSLNVSVSKDGSKAYDFWNDYCFSVSTDKKMKLDDMQKITFDLIKQIISIDNIVK